MQTFYPLKVENICFVHMDMNQDRRDRLLLDYVGRSTESAILAKAELNSVCVRVWAFKQEVKL